jgi:hypothetical protein
MKELNPIQALVDGLSAQWKKERADTQMTPCSTTRFVFLFLRSV